ncbi:MAG: O-Antigen ligase [Syntrophorhabdus sp. PtaB.Bin006]|nr:MAG: O-Antigen ligase [Syntrophorhabdus sp. PtaB.Bin006]
MLPSPDSLQIILLVTSILFLLLSFKRSVYGVIAYFIILNAKLGDMYPALGAIRFELIAAAIVLTTIFISGRGITAALPAASTLNKPLWILFIVAMLSIPVAISPAVSWENGGYFLLKLVLFYVMLVGSVKTKEDIHKLIWAFVLMAAWTAYEPVFNYVRGEVREHVYGAVAFGRFGAAVGHVALSNTLNQALPITLFWAMSEKAKQKRYLLLACVLLMVVGVVLSKSRGGFLGLIMAFCGLACMSQKKGKSILIGMVVLLVLVGVAGQGYFEHMSTMQDGITGGRSMNDRYMGLMNGIVMMLRRPLLGVGIGCYAEARSQYFGYYFYSHNLYGELLGELGLASAAWFFWIYVVYRKAGVLQRRLRGDPVTVRYANLLRGVQLGLLLRLFIGNFTHSAFIWFWFFNAGLVVALEYVMKKDENTNRALRTVH